MLSKQFAIQQSHLIQVVTDLSVQMNEVNRKLDLLLARSSLQPINQQEDTFTVPDFLTNLPVKDDTSFCHLNEQLKISHNKQSIVGIIYIIKSFKKSRATQFYYLFWAHTNMQVRTQNLNDKINNNVFEFVN